jgi:serine/threonine-protein kinase
MGEVYRALDTRLRRKVALKVLRADKERPNAVDRLFRQARATAALNHPNTVGIHDLGDADGLFYIVMELVNGMPLLAYVGDDRVPLGRKLRWCADTARALACAHKPGVLHRDVKPSNVMVSEDGTAKVLDFGLAKPVEPKGFDFRTQVGRVVGTVRYMAPEQLTGTERTAELAQHGSHPFMADTVREPASTDSTESVELARVPQTADELGRHAFEATLPGSTSLHERRAAHARAHDAARTLLSRAAPSGLIRAAAPAPGADTARRIVPRSPSDAPPTLTSGAPRPQGSPAQGSAAPPLRAAAHVSSPPAFAPPPLLPRSVPPPAPAPARRSMLPVVLTIAVLAVAVFTGSDFGMRAGALPSVLSTPSATPTGR